MEIFSTTGMLKVAIDGDETRIISFNPHDRLLRNRALQFIHDSFQDSKTTEKDIKELTSVEGKDEIGFPINASEILEYERGVSNSLREKVDGVFGAGSADKLFGMGGFDENVLVRFMNYVIEKVNAVSTVKIEEKLGHPVRTRSKKMQP